MSPIDITDAADRVPSGVHGLDERIGGGFPEGRATLISGDAGAGKTTLGLHFLMEGVRRDETSMLISADGTRPPVIHRLTIALGASPRFTELRGRNSDDVRQLASDLTREVRHLDARRVVVDDFPALVGRSVPADRVEDFVRSLLASFEDNLGCTMLLTARTSNGTHASPAGSVAERLSAGVIEVRGAPADRWLQVRKMRGAPALLDPYFVGGLSAPRNLSASEPKPSACATFSRAV
jgi:KaiC/GvpD/RAD55 family RecA-like ATPase